MFTQHGAALKWGNSHAFAVQAAAYQGGLLPVGIFHLIDKIIGQRLGIGQYVIIAVQDLAAETGLAKQALPFIGSLGRKNPLKPSDHRAADLHTIKAGT